MNYLVLGLVFILIIVIYYLYLFLTNTSLTAGLQQLNQPVTKTYQTLVTPTAITYSYQFWVYLSAPPGRSQPIFSRGNPDGQNKNDFEVDISGQQLVLKCGAGDQVAPNQIMLITNNFPIQKWTYVVINVFNLSTFEAYINGKLAKTVNATVTKPTSKMSNLVIGNSALSGYITKFTRTPKTMDAKEVWTTYLSGNGLSNFFSSIIPYGLTMSIANGEDAQRMFKIV